MVLRKPVHDVEHEHTSRVTSFSDGVFAIAITLLVLNLKIDRTLPLAYQIAAEWNDIISFVASFFVIGAAWIAHHRFFHHVRRYDDNLLWINTIMLFWIAIFPFITLMIGAFSNSALAAFLYASTMTLASVSFWLLWVYADKQGFLDSHMQAPQIRQAKRRALIGAICFGISIPVALYSVWAARVFWFLAIFVYVISDYIYRRLSVVAAD